MAKEKPIASGGAGIKIEVFPTYVVIKKNIWSKTTIPIKRIDQIDTTFGVMTIHVDKKKHRISFGTAGKAQEMRDIIYQQM